MKPAPDVLADTIRTLTARRDLLTRELATLDLAIGALDRVRNQQPAPHPLAAVFPDGPLSPVPSAPPRPLATHCQLASCGKPLPPPSKVGRARFYCSRRCTKKAARLRARAPDPVDDALRPPEPIPESGSGMHARTRRANQDRAR